MYILSIQGYNGFWKLGAPLFILAVAVGGYFVPVMGTLQDTARPVMQQVRKPSVP